ncbi:major capsid protein [Apis mellifera associated microvirus 40]|nr:major capsid protein [Apis mellifera associated microvirus 40]
MKRAKFSLSHYKLLSCDMGELVPIGLTEVLPGDTMQQATSMLVRVSPLLAPVMHPVHVRIHHWFVPHRLVWDDWEDFITGGPDGDNASAFPTISLTTTTGGQGTLADYLGVPPVASGTCSVSALPFRGYAKIWNEWYRDQDLQTELTIDTSDGVDSTTNTDLQHVAWEKDYFTSARPWEQKGPTITVPLGTTAPVIGNGTNIGFIGAAGTERALNMVNGSVDPAWSAVPGETSGARLNPDPTKSGIIADLSAASSASINDLREAFALQRYQEARARYGSRYTEYLAYLGVRSSDARLQRPEYLGGGKQVIQFSEVLQTAPESGDGVGNLLGHGIGALRSNRYRRFFEEHGYVFSFVSVKPKTMYADGLHRHWNRRIKEDFFQRELQHIGQQAILNKEIYAAHASPDGTFGYQDRYDEYRRAESGIAGDFRSTLNFWHYARLFGSQPALNADFIKSTPTKRVNQVSSEDVLWVMANHSIQARRIVARNGSSYIF